MKCPSCGIEHSGGDCPLCGFPEFVAPTPEAFQEAIREMVPEYRRSYLRMVSAVLVVPQFAVVSGKLAPIRQFENRIQFGSGEALSAGICWLPIDFGRVPQLRELPLRIVINNGRSSREEVFTVQNPGGKEHLHVGLTLRDSQDGLVLIALIRSGDGEYMSSAPHPLNGAAQ